MTISSKAVRDLITELNDGDETEHLEAKKVEGSIVGKSLYETICALSNEPDLGGGTILIGIEKEDALFPLYRAVGVSDPDKISNDIGSACATIFNIPVRVDISSEKANGKIVLRVDVPELPSSHKPLYLKATGLPRGAFRRIGPSDQHCTDDDLTGFFQAKAQESYDAHAVDGGSWDDIDPAAIDAYRRARAELNPHAEELNWNDHDILHALGGTTGQRERITATGLIVFGKTAALRRLAPSHRIDYIRVPGREWVSKDSTEFDSIDMRGPIMGLISRVMAAILDDLPKTFRVDDASGKRIDLPVIPTRVLREAVVNAVMHRNYQVAQPIQILRYANRLEIRNPGYSLKSEERFGEPGSALRNPHIAEILHETHFAETKGAGLRVMRELMGQHGLSAPTFSSNRDSDEFTAIFLFHHFLSERDWNWLSQFKEHELTEDQMRALIFVREVGAIDNSAYRSLTQTDTLSASKSLRKLREHDFLADRGSGSRTYYVAGSVLQKAGLSEDGSIHANATNMDAKRGVTTQDLPTYLRVRLGNLGRRVEPEVMEALIVDLCAWRPLSAEEIAKLVDKTSNYVSNKYLYRMVRIGALSHMYPGMVKHPGQKYMVVREDGNTPDAQ